MAFGTIKQEAGDFKNGKDHQFLKGVYYMKKKGKLLRVKYRSNQVKSLEVASEENISGLAWGAAGLVVFGGLGLVAGLMKGGKSVTFILYFFDDNSFMGTTTQKVYTEMNADFFNIKKNSLQVTAPTEPILNEEPPLSEAQAYGKIIQNITEVDLTTTPFKINNPNLVQIKTALKSLSESHSYIYIDKNPDFLINELIKQYPELSI